MTRPAYIWLPRDSETRVDAMRRLLAQERDDGGLRTVATDGRRRLSALAQAALVATVAAARAACGYARALVRRSW